MGKHAGTKRIRILQPLRLVNNYHVEISLEEAANIDIWNFLNQGPKWAPVDGSIAAISAAVGDSEYLFYEAHRSSERHGGCNWWGFRISVPSARFL